MHALACEGCHSKAPLTGGSEPTEVYFHTVLGTGSPRSDRPEWAVVGV